MKHLDLFSGIGGFSLAASWVWLDHEIVAFVEIDKFCQQVLKKHWPDVPIFEDVRVYKHNGTDIDLVTGGYPCQKFSSASHGRRTAEDLSPEMLRVVERVQPRFVIAENVQRTTIENFGKSMGGFGYYTALICLDAYAFGADHFRNRWFCVAYSDNQGKFQSRFNEKVAELQSVSHHTWGYENFSRIFRVFNGISNRTHRLKSLGNAIVPQVAATIMQAIKEVDI